MPWAPELFTAPALQQVLDKYRFERLRLMPFFDGLLTGEVDALVGSFAGEPVVQHPTLGRIAGERAFRDYVADMSAWLAERHVEIEHINFLITDPRGVEEVVVHLDGDGGRVSFPMALATDHDADGRIVELRLYCSAVPLIGRRAQRPPLLAPDAGLHAPDVVGAYQRALAAGDVDAVVAAFDRDGWVREPDGDRYGGTGELRTLYERIFCNGGGIAVQPAAVTDDGRHCALEYTMVAWGRTALAPQPGLAVHLRGDSGKLAAARVYDDVEPPPAAHA